MSIDTGERFEGCLLGLAMGDAMGAPFEGSPAGEKPLSALPGVLHYTDDTEMAIGIAESLAQKGLFDPDDMAARFADNFNPWRGYGPGTIAVIGLIKQGVPWHEANRSVFPEGSFGNGAAMRAAPVGMFFHNNAEGLLAATLGSSAITHDHPLAKEGALLITHAVAHTIRGVPRGEIIDCLLRDITLGEYRVKLAATARLLEKDTTPQEVINALGNSILAVESAPTAVYAYARHGNDYLATVRFCINLGGDTDTISAMAGAISGAHLGSGGLPPGMLDRLEDRDRLRALAQRLFEKSCESDAC
jgi:poly(ADP-ribose) glycohydrolase ARH3